MAKLNLNSISNSVFTVNASETADHTKGRADIVGAGRLLAYEFARKGQVALHQANGVVGEDADQRLNNMQYKALNERFQADHLLYAAKKACEITGRTAPETYEEFKKNARQYYANKAFYNVLSGIYEEIITPILPAVYSEAVGVFADVIPVGFGETHTISLDSSDIPVFQDSAWGAARSVPRNRFYAKDITLNPQSKTAQINAKWLQLVGNNMDFGQFFANLTAGMYAKTLGMWNAAMSAAASDTSLIPSGLSYTFEQANWVTLAQKLAAVNNTAFGNIIAFGTPLALSKVLPTKATGSTNVNMDAAIMTLLGADYVKSGYLGEYMSVRLMPLTDAIVPGTQFGNVTTILDNTKIWMMSASGRKPLCIAMDSASPISIEIDPVQSADFEIALNLTTSLDSAAVFASKVGLITLQ